jgi:hypothetical protein
VAVDGTDIAYPAPGGGLLRVPVGGGSAAQIVGLATGQLFFWDAAAGQWVASDAPPNGASPVWNAALNKWEMLAGAQPAAFGGTTGGATPVLSPGAKNIAGVVKNGTGGLTVTFATPFATTDYVALVSMVGALGTARSAVVISKATNVMELRCINQNGGSAEPGTGMDFAVFGV